MVDPDKLTSRISGVLHTMVGRQEVSALKRTYEFTWTYTGLELRLTGFRAIRDEAGEDGLAQQGTAALAEAASE